MVIVEANHFNKIPNNFTGITYTSMSKVFRKNSNFYRYYGPAYFLFYSKNKYWYFNHKLYGDYLSKYNQKQFLKDIKNQWLL